MATTEGGGATRGGGVEGVEMAALGGRSRAQQQQGQHEVEQQRQRQQQQYLI
jgi:hypothetical protein